MKILLSIAIVSASLTAAAQINQKTLELRKNYPKMSAFYPKQKANFSVPIQFSYPEKSPAEISIVSTEDYPRPSTQSIEKAFNYYNGLKKNDYSAFVNLGYALITNQRYMLNSPPQESIRFFPGNTKD